MTANAPPRSRGCNRRAATNSAIAATNAQIAPMRFAQRVTFISTKPGPPAIPLVAWTDP